MEDNSNGLTLYGGLSKSTSQTLEEKTDNFIRQIDKNHERELKPRGKHAGQMKYIEWQRRRPERYDFTQEAAFLDKRFREITTGGTGSGLVGYDGKKTVAMLKAVVALALAASIGGATVGLSMSQYDAFKEATALAETVDLPDEVYGEYNLQISNNGEAFFCNQDGKTFKEYNGVNADDLAGSYSNSVQEQSSSPKTI